MEVRGRTSGLPFAESLITRNPEIPGAVERQSGGGRERNAVVSAKATQIAVSNTTERTASVVDSRPYDPNVSIVVLNDAPNTIGEILVRSDCPALPAGQAFPRSNPQASIARAQKIKNLVAGKLFALQRRQGDKTHSIKTDQSCVSPDP